MSDATANSRAVAVGQALLVTFLWSTSWVLIKIGLDDLELRPLSFAGLRYLLAALVLLPLALPAVLRMSQPGTGPGPLGRGVLGRLLVLGVVLYAVAQGAQFAALAHLPAVSVGLVLSTTPVVVAMFSLRSNERPRMLQVAGTGAIVIGAALYFGPLRMGADAGLGLAIAVLGVAANAASALLGRSLARDALPDVGGVLSMTALSMLAGSAVLLCVGLVMEGLPTLTGDAWLIITWLAVVNTAFAFTLWNHTLRILTAVESSVMNNLMLVQIAVLAWLFLGETLDLLQLTGLVVALSGIFAVQLNWRPRHARGSGDAALPEGAVAVPDQPSR